MGYIHEGFPCCLPAPPPDLPEGASRLFDLVSPKEPRLRAAFYFGLRNTLVAEDLDAAAKKILELCYDRERAT